MHRLLLLFLAYSSVAYGNNVTEGELNLLPAPIGKPPVYPLDQKTGKFAGPLKIICDGSANQRLSSLELIIQKGSQIQTSEKLTTIGTIKNNATVKDFLGSLKLQKLQYRMSNMTCSKDGLEFVCKVGAAGSADAKIIKKTLDLRVSDGQVTITQSNAHSLHQVGDSLKITCKAILASDTTNPDEQKDKIEWTWQYKNDGQDTWETLEPEKLENSVMDPPQPAPCRAVNTTVKLTVTLQKVDHQRMYRCAYKNKLQGALVDFNYLMAATYSIGIVRARRVDDLKQERKITYTTSSLVGMILGIFSLLMVSCLGGFYTYRKNRSGKKYQIVLELLKKEEDELDKIESRLHMSKSVQEEPSSVADDPSSGAETSDVGSEATTAADGTTAG